MLTDCLSQEGFRTVSEVADMYQAGLVSTRAVDLMGMRSHSVGRLKVRLSLGLLGNQIEIGIGTHRCLGNGFGIVEILLLPLDDGLCKFGRESFD